jgi:two-component SAPR family response regulator
MRVIIVDDEYLSLVKLSKMLKEFDQITFINAYNDPLEALDKAREDNPDIAFLDIDMPGMNGLVLAEALIDILPDIEVVFVTAHDKYALQAFQIHAVGYLLKPVQFDDINKELRVIEKRYKKHVNSVKYDTIYISSFGDFNCSLKEDGSLPVLFRTEKSMELLAFLMMQKGRAVNKEVICDVLWPEMDLERATKNFYTTCYYLRKVFSDLGFPNIIIRRSNSYSLNQESIRTDFSIMEIAVSNLSDYSVHISFLEKAVEVYNGNYLGDKDYSWSSSMVHHYERCFEKVSIYLAENYIQNNDYNKAENVLNKLLKYVPISENACEFLVKFYLTNGDRASALRIYKDFENNFIHEMGEGPDNYLQNLLIK